MRKYGICVFSLSQEVERGKAEGQTEKIEASFTSEGIFLVAKLVTSHTAALSRLGAVQKADC